MASLMCSALRYWRGSIDGISIKLHAFIVGSLRHFGHRYVPINKFSDVDIKVDIQVENGDGYVVLERHRSRIGRIGFE